MITLSRILVDIDATAADHPALAHAVKVAARCGAHIKIVDVLPSVPPSARHFVTPALEEQLVAHRRERLQAIAGTIHGQPVTTELLRGRPGLALVREVLESGHELVVRSHGRDLAAGPKPFGAVDMELLRQCPCPVWLIGHHGSLSGSRIVAAVSLEWMDANTESLNTAILEWALTLKELRGAELTVLHAWTVFGGSVLRSRLPHDEFADCVAAARASAQAAMSSLLERFGGRLDGVSVELAEGEPESAIARFVESHSVDLVVMGTVARTGIPGLVMGNTAERVLQRLRVSVLAVKPPGFVSPVAKL